MLYARDLGWPQDIINKYRAEDYWRDETFNTLLQDVAGRKGDCMAVVDGNVRLTYAEFKEMVDRIAGGFAALGLGAGDHVVVQLPLRPVSCFRTGACRNGRNGLAKYCP